METESLSYEELYGMLNKDRIPKHVAIIMDGNGRWAEKRRLPRIAGHRAGIESVRESVTLAREIGISVLTLYAFSVENWKRPFTEINSLMRLLGEFLKREIDTLMKNEIRLRTIGRIENLPKKIYELVVRTEQITRNNDKMDLVLALSYGGRTEIVDSIKDVARDMAEGRLDEKELDEAMFSRYLYTRDIQDPDVLIRTSGEERLSNFLLWQVAYAELYFTKTLWPDFRKKDFLCALLEYQKRERRFGLVLNEKQVDG